MKKLIDDKCLTSSDDVIDVTFSSSVFLCGGKVC